MKLLKAFAIARGCELNTVDEAIANIEHFATMIFKYGEINKELIEMVTQFKEYKFIGTEAIKEATLKISTKAELYDKMIKLENENLALNMKIFKLKEIK
jgi:hypothetical protein